MLTVRGILPASSELVTSDLVLFSEEDFRKIFSISKDHATDLVLQVRNENELSTVAAKITGRVQEMLVEEGMSIEEGQVIALIDNAGASRLLDTAGAEYDVARATIAELQVNHADGQRTLRRIERLNSEKVSSQ